MKPPRPVKLSIPGLRKHGQKPRKPRQDHETPIHKAIFEFLQVALLPGSMIHHSPNELDVSLPEEQKRIVLGKAKGKGMRPGWPDLECFAVQKDGTAIPIMIEVKSDTGQLSQAQKDVRDGFRAIGVLYCIARSVQDVETFLEWEEIDTRLASHRRGSRP